jgi:hypothetical protein
VTVLAIPRTDRCTAAWNNLKRGAGNDDEIDFAEHAADAAAYADAGKADEFDEVRLGVKLALSLDAAEIEATEARQAIAAMCARGPCLPVWGASALLQSFVSTRLTRLNGLVSNGR